MNNIDHLLRLVSSRRKSTLASVVVMRGVKKTPWQDLWAQLSSSFTPTLEIFQYPTHLVHVGAGVWGRSAAAFFRTTHKETPIGWNITFTIPKKKVMQQATIRNSFFLCFAKTRNKIKTGEKWRHYPKITGLNLDCTVTRAKRATTALRASERWEAKSIFPHFRNKEIDCRSVGRSVGRSSEVKLKIKASEAEQGA